jgi:hypothetical protein
MKSGKAAIVHNEIISNFTSFLRSKGISERTIETIHLFHYGDGTTDGSSENERKSYKDISLALLELCKEALRLLVKQHIILTEKEE